MRWSNVGSRAGTSLAELLLTVEDMLGFKATVNRLPARSFDVKRNVLDIGRLRALTGLEPLSLREGLELTVERLFA